MPKKLFRPVGLFELALLWDSGMRAFPQRLPQQPIFYPVVNLEYARQIAHDWNTPDKNSGFAGFVTQFAVSSTFLSKFDLHTAGSTAHQEYWILAKELGSFNKAIKGLVSVEEAYFGPEFAGFVPHDHGLKDRTAVEQFAVLSKMAGRPDFATELSANRKTVFLNCLYWQHAELSHLGCSGEQRDSFFAALAKAWKSGHIGVPLPLRTGMSTP
jgi:hypothetical protein